MAEEKSAVDKLMERIQKQAIINTIKNFLEKNPKIKAFLPFILDLKEQAEQGINDYLGDCDKVIVIGRKNGQARFMILDGKKDFSVTTGLNISVTEKDTILENKGLDYFISKLTETGIFELITEEDKKNFAEMKANGSLNLENIAGNLKSINISTDSHLQIEPPKE